MIVGLFVEKPYNYCRHYYNLNLINIINIVFYRIILDLKLPTTWLHTNSNTNTRQEGNSLSDYQIWANSRPNPAPASFL